MEVLAEKPAAVNRGEQRYLSVNGQWPSQMTPPTPQEALSGAKRLYRKFMGRAWRGHWAITSGRRHTWARRGTFYVNPDLACDHGGGWRSIVHHISHYVHWKTTRLKAHDTFGQHAFLEKEMIAYVIASGWLDGKLKRAAKAVPDRQQERYQSVLRRIHTWEARQRRAATALKKLARQKAYYERVL